MRLKWHFLNILMTLPPFLYLSSAIDLSYADSQRVADKPIAEGWVQASGEVRIYLRQEDLGKLFDGTCISGVMTNGRTMPQELQNRHVAVFGVLVARSTFDDTAEHLDTTGVENYCNSNKIVIITRLVPLE